MSVYKFVCNSQGLQDDHKFFLLGCNPMHIRNEYMVSPDA